MLVYLVNLFGRLLELYVMLIVVDCIMSWIPSTSATLYDIKDALHKLTEPCYQLVRNVLPIASSNSTGIDFAPMVAVIAIQVIGGLIQQVLYRIAIWL